MSWTMIERVELSSSQASVTLGSGGTIPQTYKTLMLLISARTDRAVFEGDPLRINPNGSTANGTVRYLTGNGSTASSATDTNIFIGQATGSTATASTFSSMAIVFPNYTSTTTNKPISVDAVIENNATYATQWLNADLWSNTSAITSLEVKSSLSNNLLSGSTFTLYGLK